MNTIDERKRILEKFLSLVRPHGSALEPWANRAVIDYLRDTARKAITPKKWLEQRKGRKPSSQEIKSLYRSLGFASYCLDLQRVPSEDGYTAFTLAKENI